MSDDIRPMSLPPFPAQYRAPGLLLHALEPEEVVLGGGNVKQLKKLPPGCRAGDNANAFVGGFRLWQKKSRRKASTSGKARFDSQKDI